MELREGRVTSMQLMRQASHLCRLERLWRRSVINRPRDVPALAGSLITWRCQDGHIRDRQEHPREETLVTGPRPLDARVPDNHVQGAREGARRHLIVVLLDAHFLPVHKGRLVQEELPLLPVAACRVGADAGIRQLEVLLHVGHLCKVITHRAAASSGPSCTTPDRRAQGKEGPLKHAMETS